MSKLAFINFKNNDRLLIYVISFMITSVGIILHYSDIHSIISKLGLMLSFSGALLLIGYHSILYIDKKCLESFNKTIQRVYYSVTKDIIAANYEFSNEDVKRLVNDIDTMMKSSEKKIANTISTYFINDVDKNITVSIKKGKKYPRSMIFEVYSNKKKIWYSPRYNYTVQFRRACRELKINIKNHKL